MTIRVLVITGNSDLPETHLFVGLAKSGIEIEVMCPDTAPHRSILIQAGIPLHNLSLKGRFDKAGQQLIREQLALFNPGIIHAFNNNAVSNALQTSKGSDAKFIAYRGIVGNVSVFDPASWTTYLNPRVDKIICVANAIRDYFHNMHFLWWCFPKEKAVTIYKGHDLGWYQTLPVSRAELGLPSDAFVVGCTANERPRKGLSYLIDACEELAEYRNLHLLLIGDIHLDTTLHRIQNSAMRERIHLTGFRADAPQVLAACNACILPAIKREGLPKAVIEGMVYGVAPIVTDSGGSPELIEDGVSGVIIKPESSTEITRAISLLYKDEALCERLGLVARERIQSSFNTRTTVEQTMNVYHSVLR